MQKSFLDQIRPIVEQRVNAMPDLGPGKHNNLDFRSIFKDGRPAIIAEIKFARPGKGRIYPGEMMPVEIAKSYLANGAHAISVLCEPVFFEGNIEFIRDITMELPDALVLCKDFILDKKQIDEAVRNGASSVLLIVGMFKDKPGKLEELYNYSCSLGLHPLVEVHNRDELDAALALKPCIIGVNNRNLETLVVDMDVSRNLIEHIPANCHKVCESGIGTLMDITAMYNIGFEGFLIGTSFMAKANPGEALQQMMRGSM